MSSSQDDSDHHDSLGIRNRVRSELPALFFLALITVAAYGLLVLVPSQTRWFPRVHFYLQPGFQAYVILVTMAFFASIALLREIMRLRLRKSRQTIFLWLEILDWLRSIEYALWFVAYAVTIPVLGYLPATLGFMLLLGARVGIRSARKLAVLALIGLTIVLFFRGLLTVKMPAGQYYEFLPEPLRGFALMAL